MQTPLSPLETIERSLIKTYRKTLWSPFAKAVKQYALIQEGDKIAVCISGGKDSMLLAKLLQLLQRYGNTAFELVYLVMDPGYNAINRQKIEFNAHLLGIPISIFESQIFDIASRTTKSPCYLCARMRRGHLYAKAKEFGYNKIALGHHMSDVIETTLMGMMYGSQIQGMLPRLKSTNFEGMELIRPLYLILEDHIIAWKNAHDLTFIECACRFTEQCSKDDPSQSRSKRLETKLLIKRLKQDNKNIEQNLFHSIHRVKVDTLVGYQLDGRMHSFLERFEDQQTDAIQDLHLSETPKAITPTVRHPNDPNEG